MDRFDGSAWELPEDVSFDDEPGDAGKNGTRGGVKQVQSARWETVTSAVVGAVFRPWWIILSVCVLGAFWFFGPPIREALLAGARWTGPLFPLFVLEGGAFVGVEVASAKRLQVPGIGRISADQKTRETFAGLMTMSGSLGTLLAFVQHPDSPFADALHSTTVGLTMAVAVLGYTLLRNCRD